MAAARNAGEGSWFPPWIGQASRRVRRVPTAQWLSHRLDAAAATGSTCEVQCNGAEKGFVGGIRAFRPTRVGLAASPPRRVRQMFETRRVTKAANGGGFTCNWLRRVGRVWRSYAQFLVARGPYFSHAFSDEGEVVNNTRHARAPVLLKVFEPDCNLPNAPLERLSQPLCDRVRQQTERAAHSRGNRAALR